jgi:hypothetical protein
MLPVTARSCTGIGDFSHAMKFWTEIDQLAQVLNVEMRLTQS